MLDLQKDKEAKILQSNALVRSRQTFSMMQRRLFYLAMKAVARSDVDFRELIIIVRKMKIQKKGSLVRT